MDFDNYLMMMDEICLLMSDFGVLGKVDFKFLFCWCMMICK